MTYITSALFNAAKDIHAKETLPPFAQNQLAPLVRIELAIIHEANTALRIRALKCEQSIAVICLRDVNDF